VAVGKNDDDAAKLSRSSSSELASLIASSSAGGGARGARSRPRGSAGGGGEGGSASNTESSSMGRNTSNDARGGSSTKAPLVVNLPAAGNANPPARRPMAAATPRFGAARTTSLEGSGNARRPGVTVIFTLPGSASLGFALKMALSMHSSTADCALNLASMAGLLGADAAASMATAFRPAQGHSRPNSVHLWLGFLLLPPPPPPPFIRLTAAE
jgi:hypothetical protein